MASKPRANRKSVEAKAPVESYHWHRAVHEYCGQSLRLVLLKFKKDSIFFRSNLVEIIKQAGITDYVIFHLYSYWDVLIRVWSEEEVFAEFEKLLQNNTLELEHHRELLKVKSMRLLRADYRPLEEVFPELQRLSLEVLEDVQKNRQGSPHFDDVHGKGLLLEDETRFHWQRIQFYITIRRERDLEDHWIESLSDYVKKWPDLKNISIYHTTNAGIKAVVKAQADHRDYYKIYEFLNDVARHLQGANVKTETIFVAQPDPPGMAEINFRKARVGIAKRDFRSRFPELRFMEDFGEQQKLEVLFADIWTLSRGDDYHVFDQLFRARITSSDDAMGEHVRFFSILEDSFRKALQGIIRDQYGRGTWTTVLDEIKKKEGIQNNYDKMMLRDFCKIFKYIALEKEIFDFAPLSKENFAQLMTTRVPDFRNAVGHKPRLEHWENLYQFWREFLPTYTRLRNWLANQSSS